MKKLLLISNPSVLGKNLENILKQNYHTDFISTVPKQIGSIPLTLIMLCSWISHCYMNIVLSYVRLQKSTSQILLFCFYALPIFQNKIILDFYEAGADDHLYSTLSSPALLQKKLDILFSNHHPTTK